MLSSNGSTNTFPSEQSDKFKQAASDLECDDDPERFKDRVGKLMNHKPVEKPE